MCFGAVSSSFLIYCFSHASFINLEGEVAFGVFGLIVSVFSLNVLRFSYALLLGVGGNGILIHRLTAAE